MKRSHGYSAILGAKWASGQSLRIPSSAMAGERLSEVARTAATPLWKKLGIKPHSELALVDAPAGFEVPDLPPGVLLRHGARGAADVTIWFVTSQRTLEHRISAMVPRALGGGLWIAWPKRTSTMACELSDNVVRNAGISNGLTDFKVCAIDQDWSGLRFNRREQGSSETGGASRD